MDSRVEVTRAWDLFHLGAFAEVESLLSGIPKTLKRALCALDRDTPRRYGIEAAFGRVAGGERRTRNSPPLAERMRTSR